MTNHDTFVSTDYATGYTESCTGYTSSILFSSWNSHKLNPGNEWRLSKRKVTVNEVIESKGCVPADSDIVVWSAVDKSSYIVHNIRGLSVSLLVILIS